MNERDRLVAALGGLPDDDGFSIACVAGIDAQTALQRLEAESVELTAEQIEDWWEDPLDDDDDVVTLGATTVPGGCVLLQTWGFGASMPGVLNRLSVGTVAYGMYANPKSGNQGCVHHDGEIVGWDLDPGGLVDEESTELDRLYEGEAVAFCLAYAGLRPTDNRAFTAPDLWLRLPERDYWHA